MLSSLMIFHAVISILLIILVLVQFGKGAEAGLMSSGSEAVFTGGQQGNILNKITIVLAIIFIGNSIFLAKIQNKYASKSLLDSEAPVARPLNSDEANKAPAAPAPVATPAGTKTPAK
jgi:preprotein translocase subunit SecG